ncbi:flagellar protein [Achlya hypogyna]|uniref:Flagellar protein n=1 Tax=Achlya hypogyna TaxID=1202772 RepID=A0A1V9ZU44_ACHHY|nr:flagellar protein [Achlya hypogyna]
MASKAKSNNAPPPMVKRKSLTDDDLLKLEKMELSDDEDDFQYTNVDVLDDDDEDDEEDFQTVLRNLNKAPEADIVVEKAPSPIVKGGAVPPPKVVGVSTQVRPSVVDDFIRNFLIKICMPRTLDTFNTEWYELMAKGKLKEEDIGVVPDIYLRNQALDDQVKALRKQLDETKKITEKAKGTHHFLLIATVLTAARHEKGILMDKIKKLRKNIAAYEPLLAELRSKYEVAMKEKMLMRLERDRCMAKADALETQVRALEQKDSKSSNSKTSPAKSALTSGKKKKVDTKLPTENAVNPNADKRFDPIQIKRVEQVKTFQGHLNSIAAVAFHPKNPVIATVSDDETWKLWSMPNCELIMSGEGHRDWIAGVEFHPRGTHIATSSGDNTVKIWDFVSASCTLTLQDHAHPVWESAFHHEGDFLASCSMDHTCKLWDLATGKCRKTFRGHVDSVNSVCFQPYTVNICTGSGDKTISIWDIRSGLCVQTFYGHQNTCNSVAFSITGDTIASCDADGFIKLWDVRMVAERATIDGGQQPLNSVAFDKSGAVVAAASDDGTIKMCNATTFEFISELRGHHGPIQSVKFDPVGRYIASTSSDCTFRLWM